MFEEKMEKMCEHTYRHMADSILLEPNDSIAGFPRIAAMDEEGSIHMLYFAEGVPAVGDPGYKNMMVNLKLWFGINKIRAYLWGALSYRLAVKVPEDSEFDNIFDYLDSLSPEEQNELGKDPKESKFGQESLVLMGFTAKKTIEVSGTVHRNEQGICTSIDDPITQELAADTRVQGVMGDLICPPEMEAAIPEEVKEEIKKAFEDDLGWQRLSDDDLEAMVRQGEEDKNKMN